MYRLSVCTLPICLFNDIFNYIGYTEPRMEWNGRIFVGDAFIKHMEGSCSVLCSGTILAFDGRQ